MDDISRTGDLRGLYPLTLPPTCGTSHTLNKLLGIFIHPQWVCKRLGRNAQALTRLNDQYFPKDKERPLSTRHSWFTQHPSSTLRRLVLSTKLVASWSGPHYRLSKTA